MTSQRDNQDFEPYHRELLVDPERVQCLVGKLNYLIITRPNITFAISVVSRFMATPHVPH